MPSSTDLSVLLEAARQAGIAYPADLDLDSQPVIGASRRSFHVTMRDGVRIAVDLHLPPIPPGQTLPTCLRSTRYWRSAVRAPLSEHMRTLEVERWLRAGFALLLVDTRGTGASFGTWDRCWDDAQRDDLHELVDWVVAQEWSDGSVGGYGTSYDGTTAQLLAATGHPAVRAVVPRFSLFDAFLDISAPGGVPLDSFTELWAATNWYLDGHPTRATCPLPVPLQGSVRPVDDDVDGSLLAAAQAEHAGNWDLWGNARGSDSRDGAGPLPDAGMGTPLARIDALRRHRVPTWLWSGWYDGAYAAAQLAQLADAERDVRVTIGPFAHGALMPSYGDPLLPHLLNQPMHEQLEEISGFLRFHLTGTGTDPSPARLRYYRMGDGWHTADAWPPAKTTPTRLSLSSDGVLGGTAAGGRTYDVDFTAGADETSNRWASLLGGAEVVYQDRAESDAKRLVWDGSALAGPTGVTGTPILHVELTSDASDFALHAYLEVVLPDGTVQYMTEGALRASARKPGTGPAPYATYGPWHSHLTEDTQPVTPGEVTSLDFTLLPISFLVPQGSRLRVALAGAAAATFRRIPEQGDVRLEIHSSSWIEIPLELSH